MTDALVDFTGGVAETYDLNIDENDFSEKLNHLMETINHELSNHSIVCLKINVSIKFFNSPYLNNPSTYEYRLSSLNLSAKCT